MVTSYFRGKTHFENYLMFQPFHKHLQKKNANINHILARRSKGLSDKSIKSPPESNNSLAATLNYIITKL